MKKSEPESIEEIIRNAISMGEMADNFDLQRASAMWGDVVGSEINTHTTRRYVDGSTLHVYLNSAPLKNELQFHRAEIVEHLNNAVGRRVLTQLIIH